MQAGGRHHLGRAGAALLRLNGCDGPHCSQQAVQPLTRFSCLPIGVMPNPVPSPEVLKWQLAHFEVVALLAELLDVACDPQKLRV